MKDSFLNLLIQILFNTVPDTTTDNSKFPMYKSLSDLEPLEREENMTLMALSTLTSSPYLKLVARRWKEVVLKANTGADYRSCITEYFSKNTDGRGFI